MSENDVDGLSCTRRHHVDERKHRVECPFPLWTSQCLKVLTAVTVIGYLDSAIDLGINAAAQDRVVDRRTTDCAVLSTRNRVKSEINPDGKNSAYPYANVTYFFYGESQSFGENYTWRVSNYTLDNSNYDYWYDVR